MCMCIVCENLGFKMIGDLQKVLHVFKHACVLLHLIALDIRGCIILWVFIFSN